MFDFAFATTVVVSVCRVCFCWQILVKIICNLPFEYFSDFEFLKNFFLLFSTSFQNITSSPVSSFVTTKRTFSLSFLNLVPQTFFRMVWNTSIRYTVKSSVESTKPSKLKRYLEANHSYVKGKTENFSTKGRTLNMQVIMRTEESLNCLMIILNRLFRKSRVVLKAFHCICMQQTLTQQIRHNC